MRRLSVLFLGLTLFVLFWSLRTEEQFKEYEHYTVRSEDSIRAIAESYKISRTELLEVNIIDADHPFVIGRVLRIPGQNLAVIKRVEFKELEKRGDIMYLKGSDAPEEQFKEYEHYTVRSGDSVRAIAKAYNISRTELLAANIIDEDHPLVSGMVLRIPEPKLAVIKRVDPVAESKPAEEAPVNSNLTYEIKGDAVTITGGDKKTSGALIIPAAIEGKSVTSIGEKAFYYCTSLTSITIPDSVTNIGKAAFVGCKSLTRITIPNSVTSIGEEAFVFCESLTSIRIPDSVTSIEEATFVDCESLTSITIPDSVTSIENIAFMGCESLTSITIPDSVTNIGGRAFQSCINLTSITIPDGVTNIWDSFYYCNSLTSITIPDSVTSIGSSAFIGCSNLTSITIPDSVTSIGDWAFQGCTSLTSITIPDGVTSIGEAALSRCKSLTTIEVGAGNVNYTDVDGVLFNSEKTVILACPAGKTGTSYTIPDSVTTIGGAFMGCESLTSITIPDSVTSIGSSAFFQCSSLTSITIPDSVTSIGDWAFMGCENLASVTIPDSVTSIGEAAFSDCTRLTSVTFLGDAPKEGKEVFTRSIPIIYRKPEAKGWGNTWGGRRPYGRHDRGAPVKLISEKR